MSAQTIYAAGLLAYDGTDYHGYQYQVGVSSVQAELERALEQFCEPLSRVVAAGRTDAGVHASSQVIAVRAGWRHGPERFQRAWNAHLPFSLCVREVCEAPETFHPRFSACWRTYRYQLVVGDNEAIGRSPLTDRYAWFVNQRIDVEKMQAAAENLVGERDFATFGQPTQGDSTVRRICDARWDVNCDSVERLNAFPGQRLVFTITANGFLRQMVRTIVGSLVEIGLGKRRVDWMQKLLDGKERCMSAPPAPACGLSLERVVYPAEFGLFSHG